MSILVRAFYLSHSDLHLDHLLDGDTGVLGFGPTVYAVRWKENVYLGMVVHCTLNTLGITLVASLVLGRI